MKRLTERDEYGNAYIIALSDMMPELYAGLSFSETNVLTDALNRLAAYEDTGLEPEEVEKLAQADAIAALVKENTRLRDNLKRTERERDAAITDIYNMGGCPNCKYNSGRSSRTGLPICSKNLEYPDGKCFEWRGLEAAQEARK